MLPLSWSYTVDLDQAELLQSIHNKIHTLFGNIMVLLGTSLPLVQNETRAGRIFPSLQCASLYDLSQNDNVCKGRR